MKSLFQLKKKIRLPHLKCDLIGRNRLS